jgi:hypothetical protein
VFTTARASQRPGRYSRRPPSPAERQRSKASQGDRTFATFDRDRPTLIDAVTSAIRDIETVAGFYVLHVDPDELVWAAEIADRTNRTRQSINQLINGQRGPGQFPAPANNTTRNPLWYWPEVEAWFARYNGQSPDTERFTVTAAINAALQARRLTATDQPHGIRHAIQKLLAS